MAINGLMFGRVAIVTVVGKLGAAIIPNKYEIQYNIAYESGKSTAEITVINPPKTLTPIADAAKTVTITAGYEQYNGVIFTGVVTRSEYIKTTKTATLKIVATGGKNTPKKRISVSGAPGITCSALVGVISAQTQTKISIDNRVIDTTYPTGYSFLGRGIGAINEIATRLKAKAIETSTGISLVPIDNTTPPESVVVLTPKTGLVGYPKRITKNKKTGWAITTLLNHKITIAGAVHVQSEVTGLEDNIYIVDKVIHKGSNRTGTSNTVIEIYNKGKRV